MNSGRDEQAIPDLEAVGKAYREARFDDEPPAHVDAFIRAAAKRESKRNLSSYLPSLAVAATTMLALGLVLRLTVPGRDLPAPTSLPEADEAAAPPALRSGTVQEPEDFREQAAPLADSPAPATEFVPAPEADMLAPAGVASSVLGRIATPNGTPCAGPVRGDPNLWLECIAAQIDAGVLDAARAELQQFRLVFADYPVPANITEALDP